MKSATLFRKPITLGIIVLLAGGGLVWWIMSHNGTIGGSNRATENAIKTSQTPKDSLQTAMDAYRKGNYKAAEAEALSMIKSKSESRNPAERKIAVRARYIYAFSAARQKDMKAARERFADLKNEASKLPDKGKQYDIPGQMPITLEEEGAYQHAVCTAALGDKKAAESEYMKFIHDYPESPLINGAVMRIEKLHNGHLPAQAEAAWTKAMAISKQHDAERRRDQAMCAAECLTELLRRQGKTADVHKLANEMGTTEYGTSMKALAEIAKKHGLPAKGYSVTLTGMLSQPTPFIALIIPGHFVLVDKATPKEVTVWDPSGKGLHKPSTNQFTVKEWKKRAPNGIIMVLQNKNMADEKK